MAKTTMEIYENAWQWANKQRMELGRKRDEFKEKIKVTKKEIKNLEFEIEIIDDVIETLKRLRDNGGIED